MNLLFGIRTFCTSAIVGDDPIIGLKTIAFAFNFGIGDESTDDDTGRDDVIGCGDLIDG